MSKDQSLKPIPTPFAQRVKQARLRLVPIVTFTGVLCAIAFMWKDYVAAPSMVGQAEPVLAHVSSYKPGVLAELKVNRFQKVHAGDVIGQVMITDPKILASSLAVLQSEIEMVRLTSKPLGQQQRYAIDYDQVQLNWMKSRADLASARVNLQLAESEFARMEALYKDQIVSSRAFDQAKANHEKLQAEVVELTKIAEQAERNVQDLRSTNSPALAKISADPILAAIEVQKAKLKLTEEELSPIVLKAPMDGIVTAITLRAGEAVVAGQPIVSIATLEPVRIVGYMRPPIDTEPKVGMKVEVRTRGTHRQIGSAQIMEIGTQMESVPPTLLSSAKLASAELGLPIDISLPHNCNIRPGELVDIILLSRK